MTDAKGEPLPLDRIPAYAEYCGVKLAMLGVESDEGWVALTHDRQRGMAALNRLFRVEFGVGKDTRSLGERQRDARRRKGAPRQGLPVWTGQVAWWLVFDRCGCGEECKCELHDGYGSYADHDCKRLGLPPCSTEFFWVPERCAKGTSGAVPVMRLDVRP